MNSFIDQLGGANYGMIWLDIETNPSPGCSWDGRGADSNCAFVNELLQAGRARGKQVGIYSNYYMWSSIMGAPGNCNTLGQVPLWYAHYDNWESFQDF